MISNFTKDSPRRVAQRAGRGIFERNISRNRPLYDGTPRRESGYRVVVGYFSGQRQAIGFGLVATYATSPLFETRQEAEAWVPDEMRAATDFTQPVEGAA